MESFLIILGVGTACFAFVVYMDNSMPPRMFIKDVKKHGWLFAVGIFILSPLVVFAILLFLLFLLCVIVCDFLKN